MTENIPTKSPEELVAEEIHRKAIAKAERLKPAPVGGIASKIVADLAARMKDGAA